MGIRPLLAGLLFALLAAAALPPAAIALPACGEPPETVGRTMYGTPCADTIRLPRSVTTVFGEGGDDTLYGQRGNDRLFGGDGNDRLYGGIGDDQLRGGSGSDRLSGGFGADSLDGESGDDLARGDATIDSIGDSGGGTDTLSFATGATPGFPNSSSFFTEAGFPAGAEGRGVFVDLGDDFANNGQAPSGGGVDQPLAPAPDFGAFEVVIGTAFADYIVGTADAETFHGGAGGDLIDGGGGADVAHGGAGGDGCVAVAIEDCESNDEEIDSGDPSTVAVGDMAPQAGGAAALYLTGSDGDDAAVATYSPAPPTVAFTVGGDDAGTFVLAEPPDSLLLAGMAGDDTLAASGFPETVSVVLLGNRDGDELTSGDTEDAVVDGAGPDVVSAGGRDDAVPNNGGADHLDAGAGEDLFVSNAVCDGDSIDGGPDRDNANWANFTSGVAIDMSQGTAGLIGSGGQPSCPAGSLSTLEEIEDIEGTNLADNLVGDAGPNQILGRAGSDAYVAGAGNDFLLANSGDSDPLLDCGEGFDTALIDFATSSYADATPVGCESVEARAPNSFRPPDTPPDPEPEPEPPPAERPPLPAPASTQPPSTTSEGAPAPSREVERPRTRLLHRPARLLFARTARRRVAFRFAADESGARFRCRIDRRRFRPCRSPRVYFVRPGRHAFRVFAIDAAGNRDRSHAVVRFRVRRR